MVFCHLIGFCHLFHWFSLINLKDIILGLGFFGTNELSELHGKQLSSSFNNVLVPIDKHFKKAPT
jgi:hypothetical protein